jgi:hypothetical protein
MFDLAYISSPAAERDELRPARALLTPTWIAALALLVANDHWLKGAGLVPELLTGKLSDFAGMLVAPVLLAALLQVRSRRALLACHLAVAAVFTGIQLSPAFAASWSAVMGLVGHPWAITCDPWDLVALPFLLLSWKLLVPAMDPELPALIPLQRSAVAGLSVFGLWSTVATSDTGVDFDDEWYEDVYGHVYLNNANEFEISLHIRELRDDIEVDCAKLATDPGRLLDDAAFGEAEHWLLPARTNVAIEFDPGHGCGAAWIAGEGIEPQIVFIGQLASYPAAWWPGQSFDPTTLGRAGMAIEFDGSTGRGEWLGGDDLRHTPRSDAPEQPESCEPAPAEARLDWSQSIPGRDARVLAIEAGPDGCFELELQEVILTGDQGEPYPFYLCAPEAAVPFAVGELLDFDEAVSSSGARELTVTLSDPESLTELRDEYNRPVRRVRYLRGGNDPLLIGPALGRDLVAISSYDCPWQVDAGECATVERRVDLSVAGGQSFFAPGEAVSFADDPSSSAMVRTAVLGYARELALLDLACAEGSLRLSYDIDLAVIEEPLI